MKDTYLCVSREPNGFDITERNPDTHGIVTTIQWDISTLAEAMRLAHKLEKQRNKTLRFFL